MVHYAFENESPFKLFQIFCRSAISTYVKNQLIVSFSHIDHSHEKIKNAHFEKGVNKLTIISHE